MKNMLLLLFFPVNFQSHPFFCTFYLIQNVKIFDSSTVHNFENIFVENFCK